MRLVPHCASRTPGVLCALLALLLLLPPEPQVHAGPVATVLRELRCVCLSTTPGIHPKTIANLQVTVSGPKCPRVEVVASLKNGKQVCLDPEAPLIKKVIQKMLDSGNKQN
ncbi:alveolar macrophage chemotactic factor [Heterocephalus glaber]|uniref:C-X-C motif chemokine n=1 Tax=Heterocephalus glaber TaxID=10181 RepID=A0AAX6NP92_HETGA|nr:alveolar macrophage chemotactic factor [Heterocephalus glaber]